jgi:hypothetical protein
LTSAATAAAHRGEEAQMNGSALTGRDLAIGTGIAGIMGWTFVAVGGVPLAVTFVPGLIVTWGIFAWMWRHGVPLPPAETTYPLYFGALAWQFIHFCEEFITGFNAAFPPLFGSPGYGADLFVGINMFSYFVFTLAFILVFARGLRFLYVPVLFFAVYGVVGNAVAHVVWVAWERAYFPGFFTAPVYWLLGPLLLTRLTGSRRIAGVAIAAFAVLLVSVLLSTMR